MDLKPPKSPERVACGIFSYDKQGGFRAYGHPREMVEPSMVIGRSRSWLLAQLTHYGVTFDPEADDSSLKEMLLSLAQEPDALQKPSDVKAFAEDLRAKYLKRLTDYRVAMVTWRERKFASLKSPTDQIKFDIEKFMAKYFLDYAGKPSPSKTREALVLKIAPMGELREFVDSIPGLRVRIGYNITVVGWEESFSRGLDRAFESIGRPSNIFDVPTSEAMFDVPRFIRKYFLDEEGRALPSKTTEPVQLSQFLSSKQRELLASTIQTFTTLTMAEIVSIRGRYTIVGWEDDVNVHTAMNMAYDIYDSE
ncbi:hypothetical protein F5X99DRAFT_406788 [Biscogniauxia marginata]|nr:hypothetical protein F5X99DRAFT_406788 [Biscogniauxia marginata]